VAGDYYDAFFATTAGADGGKLTLVIADVAGKSIPAALLMATLQASLRTIAGEGASLADLVMRLNRYACAHSLDGRRFTTAVLAEYEPAARRLSYVTRDTTRQFCGGPTATWKKLDIGGVPLGIHSVAEYETSAKDLQPGDALIFSPTAWSRRSMKVAPNSATSGGWRRFARYRKLRLGSRCNF